MAGRPAWRGDSGAAPGVGRGLRCRSFLTDAPDQRCDRALGSRPLTGWGGGGLRPLPPRPGADLALAFLPPDTAQGGAAGGAAGPPWLCLLAGSP